MCVYVCESEAVYRLGVFLPLSCLVRTLMALGGVAICCARWAILCCCCSCMCVEYGMDRVVFKVQADGRFVLSAKVQRKEWAYRVFWWLLIIHTSFQITDGLGDIKNSGQTLMPAWRAQLINRVAASRTRLIFFRSSCLISLYSITDACSYCSV
jgi:hypothetical protein